MGGGDAVGWPLRGSERGGRVGGWAGHRTAARGGRVCVCVCVCMQKHQLASKPQSRTVLLLISPSFSVSDAPCANAQSLLLRPHQYRREVQKATNDRSQIEKSIEESGESAPPPLVCAPLRGQVRSTRRAIARRVAVPNAKPDAKKKTRARSFLGRCVGTGKPAASASRAR